jgi:hypothetical protein
MLSPFPGMDPYLEEPGIWPDFHHAFAVSTAQALNAALPDRSYALVLTRAETGAVDGGSRPRASGWLDEPIRRQFIEIRDANRDHRLVTAIEILSPTNKGVGPDRDAYAKRQHQVLASDASLVEIDLLRDGRCILPDPSLEDVLGGFRPRPHYVVLISPAWKRGSAGQGCRVYPIGLRGPLPCLGIPLKAESPDVALDLQHVFNRVYEGGPYRRGAVDYGKPPEPPLSDDDAAWVEATLREHENPLIA